MSSSFIPKPFTLSVSDAALDDLRNRLELTRLPSELSGAGSSRGTPLDTISRLVSRWKNGHDWRKREAEINELPMFTGPVEVDGFGPLDIHFVHQKGMNERAIPLLFSHGWPGHFLEIEKILPLLTNASGEHPSFHVVAPSLPGFGFSEYPTKTGFGLVQYAEVCHKLMLSLGYDKYVTQGGDWGTAVVRIMSQKYGGTHAQAMHSNPSVAPAINPLKNPIYYVQHLLSEWSSVEQARAKRTSWFSTEGSAYNNLQATRPQTIGYSLEDSPAGLLAWIYEKLVEWTDDYPWQDDEVLDWVSIYWFSRSGPAAASNIYYEYMHNFPSEMNTYCKLPTGFSLFPQEIEQPTLASMRASHNVVFFGHHAHGGHFAAHEQPIELVGDLRKMFGRGGPAYGVVKGKEGY